MFIYIYNIQHRKRKGYSIYYTIVEMHRVVLDYGDYMWTIEIFRNFPLLK